MLANILTIGVLILGGVAMYSSGWSDGYRDGYMAAEADAAPEVYRPQPHTKKGGTHGDEERVFRP